MIAKIKRGTRLGGLMTYLLGPGDSNEHSDRHIIAGSPTVMRDAWLEHFDGDREDSREVALAVAGEINIPRKLYGTQVKMRAKKVAVGVGGRELGMDVVERAAKGEPGEMRDAPVWHCVLSLEPGEELSDEAWSQLVTTFMDRMGFTGTPDGKRAQARWAAVRHGLSGEHGDGQDHIHIAASLVREDGSKVNTYDYGPGKKKGDYNHSYEVCGELEREFGLKLLPSRAAGVRGLPGHSRAERERADRRQAPETERETLHRVVLALATATETEADFVRELHDAGISVRPRYAPGGRTRVDGYSVRLRHPDGETGPWLGGGSLAGDLSLPALRRQQWTDNRANRDAALPGWDRAAKQEPEPGVAAGRGRGAGQGLRPDREALREAVAEIREWSQRLHDVPSDDRAQWAWTAGQAAGCFAAWSYRFEGGRPGPFAHAARELSRSAQVQYASDRYTPPAPPVTGRRDGGTRVSNILLQAAVDTLLTEQPAEAQIEIALMLALLLVLIALIALIIEAHRDRGELPRAMALEDVQRGPLRDMQREWEEQLDRSRHQVDRDLADVAMQRAERTTTREAEPTTTAAATEGETTAKLIDAAMPQKPGKPRRGTRRADAERRDTTTRPKPPHKRRWYTDVTDPDTRSGLRIREAAVMPLESPLGWTSAQLDYEESELRGEIAALEAEITTRRAAAEGPAEARTSADHPVLVELATKVRAAQAAQKTAADLKRQESTAEFGVTLAQRKLDDIPSWKFLPHGKATTALTEAKAKHTALTKRLETANEQLEAALADAPAPEQWNDIVTYADPDEHKRRLAAARRADRADIDADTGHLQSLRHRLDHMHYEQNRRSGMTDAQVRADIAERTRPRTTSTSLDQNTHRPEHGQSQSSGPELGA